MNDSSFLTRGLRANRGRKAWRVALGSLIFALFAPAVWAQSNALQMISSNRWLFVVDTSRAMQHRAESIRRAPVILLLSGMNGQMRRGDTVGLWTYDAELRTGKFPVQTWTPEGGRNLARRMYTFLQAQKFQKESRLDLVVPSLNVVISNSAVLTIILISGGEEKISGTPFDDAINDAYEGWREEQEKARMPFVTLLRAEHGRITNQKVNLPPRPMEIPPLPVESQVVKTPDNISPRPMAQPLIFSGRKPAATQTQEVSQPPETSAPPSTLSTNNSAPETDRTPAPAETNPPATSGGAAEMAKATLVADAGAAAVDPPTRPVEKIEAHSATTDASLPKSETAEPPATKPVSEATLSVRTHIEEARSAPPAGTVETATATPADSSLRLKAIWFGLLGAAGVASLLLWLMLRRSRSTAPASLITRSLDREKK